MDNKELYRKAQSNIAARRQRAQMLAEEQKKTLAKKVPQLAELDNKILALGVELARISASGAAKADIDTIVSEMKACDAQRQDMLKAAGCGEDMCKISYSCAICKDTGRVGGSMCECVHKEANLLRREALCRVSPLSLCSFDTFSLQKYSNDGKQGAITQRGHMQGILAFCQSYAQDFSKNSDSLYMCGSAGLGKTHLALSIANVVLQRGFDVLYSSSQSLFDTLEKEHFTTGNNTMAGLLTTDLLILDDLGTEYITPYIGSCMYDIINTRWNSKLPTIYTSNFVRTEDLAKRYTEKIVSRLLGSCETLHFVGEDIRLADK